MAVTALAALTAAVAIVTAPAASADVATTLYASPSVADGSGRDCSSVADACSLLDARNKVRTLNDDMSGDIVVELLGGNYPLPSTFQLTESAGVHDSGTNGYDVIYENFGTDVPVLSGGRTITGWTLYDAAKGIYSAPAPAGVNSRQLYVNGLRQTRARGVPTGTWTKTTAGYTVTDGALSTYKNLTGVELIGRDSWQQFRCTVASATASTVTMVQPCWRNSNLFDWSQFAAVPDWIENAYELIDQPGEWYLDRTGAVAGNGAPRLYLKPTEPAKLASSKVVLPVLETLVSATGTSENRLHNVQFKGIRFENATWLRPGTSEGYASRQTGYLWHGQPAGDANTDLDRTPGNVDVQEATNIRFERDTFTRLGAVGLSVMKGTQDITIVGNRFEDISGSAVSIGDPKDHHPANESEYVKNVSFTDNLITRIGAEYQDQSAVTAAYPQYTDVSHNEIFDLPYTGISMGIGWGRNDADPITKAEWEGFTTPTPLRNNTITYNDIHDVMRDVTDGGAIYTESDQPDSVISDNYLHNPNTWFGVYLDNGTQHYSVTNNVMSGFGQWAALNWPSGNNSVTGNYVNTYGSYRDIGVGNSASGNITGLTSWPAAAQSIIDQAGIRPEYAGVKQTDLSLNATATASSSVGANWAPSYAADGSARTGPDGPSQYTQRWLTGPGFPRTLSLDLGRQYSLSSIKQTTSETDGSTSSYKVEASVDSGNWVTLVDHTGAGVPNGTSDDVSGTYRYVRLTVTGVDNGHWASSAELEVYGTPPWDAAHHKDVTVSSGADVAADAVDGFLETTWRPTGPTYPQSLYVDFKYPKALRAVRQLTADTDTSQYSYKIEGRVGDNTPWVTLVDRTVNPRTGPVLVDVVSGSYRFVRVTMTGATNGHGASFSELQVLVD